MKKSWRALSWFSCCSLYIQSTCCLRTGTTLSSRRKYFQSTSSFFQLLSLNFLAESSIGGKLDVPLVFLPTAGCLAAKFTLEDKAHNPYQYYAVLDTGSPFLTASKAALAFTCDASQDDTNEQYGETTGNMQWRVAEASMESFGRTKEYSVVIGIPQESLVDATGGIFCGLILVDDTRPTFLQQTSFSSFIIDSQARTMSLSPHSVLKQDKESMPMYDLSRFGPNLHHYAIQCDELLLETKSRKYHIPIDSLARDVVMVIDTGLTGCILSDSWKECLPVDVREVQGGSVRAGSSSFRSQPRYWYLSCFRLPWFSDEQNHPHIIVLGATFLNGSKIIVDTKKNRIRVETPNINSEA